MYAMKRKALWIAIAFAVGIAWAILPYLIGPIPTFQSFAYAIASPGVEIGGLIFGQNIKHSLTIAPISMAINFLIAACVVYFTARLFSSGSTTNRS
jgi:hypothetical protein